MDFMRRLHARFMGVSGVATFVILGTDRSARRMLSINKSGDNVVVHYESHMNGTKVWFNSKSNTSTLKFT